METKLTLSIESGLARMIKSYAKRKGCTLSGLVESYFFTLVKNDEINETTMNAPLEGSLSGSLRSLDKVNYKEELANFLEENIYNESYEVRFYEF